MAQLVDTTTDLQKRYLQMLRICGWEQARDLDVRVAPTVPLDVAFRAVELMEQDLWRRVEAAQAYAMDLIKLSPVPPIVVPRGSIDLGLFPNEAAKITEKPE